MQWIDIEQNTDEWMQLRVGKTGGSSIGKIMANYGKAFGDPAKKLAVNVALGRITGKSNEENYTNAHMQRGHEQEPIARALYESTYFTDVTNGGFYDAGNIGVSPDGLVGSGGIIEIKSVIATTHFATVSRGRYDPSYKWQLYLNLKVSGRDWIDYVSFCSEFPEGKRLFVQRLYSSDSSEEFKMIDDRMEQFERLVDTNTDIILSA